jgi:choline dehydrogenase-like flavoprotein
MAQVIASRKVHPVVVVGSGASGGMAAWNLTRKGIDVLMLDAGTKFERSQFWTHVRPWEARARRARGERPPQFFLDTKEQPYLTPPDKPFQLIRVWGHGGKTNVWGRVSLRYSDLDFKGPARDGWEIPWPIEYKDVAPYYDQVDQLIGVSGGDDDSDSLPGSKFHLPPPAPRCGEVLLTKAFAKHDIPIVAGRRANFTKPVRNFPACHYCGNCGAGCDTASFFCSADHLLPDALKTGKLELRSNAVVARILVNDKGLAEGVQYFDRQTGREERVYAKVVVMGASAVDTTRILLNSKSTAHPNGLGNGSDVIGRYLCEQLRVHVAGFLPALYGNGVQNDLGIGGEHIYMPRFNHRRSNLNYLRGFQMQFWNTGCQPYNLPRVGNTQPGFGAGLKAEIKRKYPAWVELHPFGETLPYAHNRITVDESQPDRYGVPTLKIDYQIGDNERKMADHIYDVLDEVGRSAGIEWVQFKRGELDSNGSAIHEHGCCRMGEDPSRSALNKWNQMHEVKNVFVVDGSAFTSASEKNPTLTILALSWRATDYLAEEVRKGNL